MCSWGRDKSLKLDEMIIFCESYRDKKGSQRAVYADNNPLQLVSGELFYTNKKVLFSSIVGFATFEQYMVVAEVSPRHTALVHGTDVHCQLYESSRAIGLKVSLDGKNFALARFPPNMHLENQVSLA